MSAYAAEAPLVVWPENVQAVLVFRAMQTQWLVAANGRYGLNYAVLPVVEQRLKVPPEDIDQVFTDLRVLEASALEEMHADDK